MAKSIWEIYGARVTPDDNWQGLLMWAFNGNGYHFVNMLRKIAHGENDCITCTNCLVLNHDSVNDFAHVTVLKIPRGALVLPMCFECLSTYKTNEAACKMAVESWMSNVVQDNDYEVMGDAEYELRKAEFK